jgi:hypothetical protein
MVPSRAIALSLNNPVSLLTDQELRIAIAREAVGLRHIRVDERGDISGSHPTVLTTVPVGVPDWPNDENAMSDLEQSVHRHGLWYEYSSHLHSLAGLDESSASPRQRAEAALYAFRSRTVWG